MKSIWIVAVLVCVVLTSGAWAQFPFGLTPRALGMGGTAIGVADDGGAWFQNPAGLAALNVPVPEGRSWGHDLIGSFGDVADTNLFGATWSGWTPEDRWGAGAGVIDIEDAATLFGAGAGIALRNTPLSFGANFIVIDPDLGSDETLVNLGALYRFAQPERGPIRVGMTVTDITDELGPGPFFNVGASAPLSDRLLVAVDVVDITDEIDTGINAGIEYTAGRARQWRLRGGTIDLGDNELTLGVGFQPPDSRWRVDFAWVNTDPDSLWSIGVGVNLP